MIPEILYDDEHICVCEKPAGITSESGGMVDVLSERYASSGQANEIYPVHRLDAAVSGLMVYARTRSAAAFLSNASADRTMKKQYLAVISGELEDSEGVYADLLFRDSSKNKSYVVKRMRRGVREAKLSYRLLEKSDDVCLVLVTLETGRSHQIRVQFSSRGTPLLGDVKYGGPKGCPIALYSHKLSFPHPSDKRQMSFSKLPENTFPWSLFKYVKEQ